MSSIDWESLRLRSLKPGGFGEDRVHIWPQLLNAGRSNQSPIPEAQQPHEDEHQISLDTARSFVLYPSPTPTPSREDLQAQLHDLITSVFRAHPKLSYFQGYHDIVSVLMLTLPKELQFVCVEKLSLHWLRDSMGEGLEPVLGLLRVTKNLIRLADPELASMLEQTSQLPFFALSNLLTLFSHDTPTLSLIQHVFDYLLCRPPIAVVYLAAAIIISRKDQVRRLLDEDEDGMIHSLLSSLPDLVDVDIDAKTPQSRDKSPTLRTPSSHSEIDTETEKTLVNPSPFPEEIPLPDSPSPTSDLTLVDSDPSQDSESKFPPSPKSSSMRATPCTPIQPPSSKHSISLPTLLTLATTLSSLYPPTHPSLNLSRIMGPQSVIFTWSEDFRQWPRDDEAERMVIRSDLIVYPPPTLDYSSGSDEEGEEEEVYEEARRWSENSGKPQRRKRHRKLTKKKHRDTPPKSKSKRNTLLNFIPKKLKFKIRGMEKQTVLAGAVLLFGIGLAVYNVKRPGSSGSGGGVSGNGSWGWKAGVGKHSWSWW